MRAPRVPMLSDPGFDQGFYGFDLIHSWMSARSQMFRPTKLPALIWVALIQTL